MTKDELIARLQVLGEQLNRDVSLTGTKEELVLRVAELEEELDDTDDAAGQDTSVSPENALPDSELDAWMESRIYPVMSDIPALSDLITSMVASGYDYRRDDDAGLWSSADLTYVITYEM
ncbi:phage tail terminator protein [Escherichia coli]